MTGGKKYSKEKKKRRRSSSHEPGSQGERKRRTNDHTHQEPESSALCVAVKEDEDEVEELSEIEEGGLDLNVPLKPISFYISDRKVMLDHCFRVLGDKKLKKMLPDMLKELPLDEIKHLCLEQVEMENEDNLLRILQGETGMDSTVEDEAEKSRAGFISQNNLGLEDVDGKAEKGEDCDALSINADTFDSDIEGPSFEERNTDLSLPAIPKVAGESDDLVMDIEKSVNEILGMAQPVAEDMPPATAVVLPEDMQPSAQQLDLLELEMRARAIKALMKASDVKKT